MSIGERTDGRCLVRAVKSVDVMCGRAIAVRRPEVEGIVMP